MTKTNTNAPFAMTLPRAQFDTIYRDPPLASPTTARSTRRLFPRLSTDTLTEEHVSNGILLGLAALLLPTVVYSFTQMWSLVSGGTLEHAVRAFFP